LLTFKNTSEYLAYCLFLTDLQWLFQYWD